MEFILETQGMCLLCRQEIVQPPSHEDPHVDSAEEDIQARSLKVICRYLKINCYRVFTQGLETRLDQEQANGFNQKEYTFWSKFCECCGKVVMNLTELILELDVMQMLIRDSLQSLLGILSAAVAQNGTNSMQKRKQPVQGPDRNSLDARLVELLQNQLKIKCVNQLETLESSFPKIRLTRCKREVPEFKSKSAPPIQPEVPQTEEAVLESPDQTKSSTTGKSLPRFKSTDRIKILVRQYFPRQTVVEVKGRKYGKRTCGMCGVLCCNTKVRTHIVTTHIDKVLEFTKEPQISQQDFKQFCETVLNDTKHKVVSRKKVRRGQTSTSAKINCAICNYQHRDSRLMQYHLVTCHLKEISAKLNALQEEELDKRLDFASVDEQSVENIINAQPSTVDGQNSILCSYCNQAFCGLKAKSRFLEIHCIRKHLEEIFAESKPPKQSGYQFRKFCRQVLKEQLNKCDGGKKCNYCSVKSLNSVRMTCHLVYNHREIIVSKLKKMGSFEKKNTNLFPNEIAAEDAISDDEENNKIVEPSCTNDSVSSSGKSSHRSTGNVALSKSIIKNKKRANSNQVTNAKLDESVVAKMLNSTCPAEVESLMKERLETIVKIHCCLSGSGQKYQCGFCTSSNPIPNIRIHLANFHPEKVIPMSFLTKAVTMEYYQNVCDLLLNSLAERRSPDFLLMCQLCKATYTYNDIGYVKNHLIISHSIELMERLKLMLEQENVSNWKSLPDTIVPVSLSPGTTTNSSMCLRVQLNEGLKSMLKTHCRRTDLAGGKKEIKYHCNLCGMVCANTKIRPHIANMHAEIILNFAKYDHVSDEDFKKCCNFVLDKWLKCSFFMGKCRKTRNTRYSRMHLMLFHSDKLVDKLKELQGETGAFVQIQVAASNELEEMDIGESDVPDKDPLGDNCDDQEDKVNTVLVAREALAEHECDSFPSATFITNNVQFEDDNHGDCLAEEFGTYPVVKLEEEGALFS